MNNPLSLIVEDQIARQVHWLEKRPESGKFFVRNREQHVIAHSLAAAIVAGRQRPGYRRQPADR